jgi:hypothetical protein
LTVDRSGRTWLAAVATDGRSAVISTPAGAQRWHRSRGLPQAPPSETSSPTLTSTVGGVLVGVTNRRGRAEWRRPWGPSGPLPATHGPRGGGFSVSRFL